MTPALLRAAVALTEPGTAPDLAERLGCSRKHATRLVESLRALGYVHAVGERYARRGGVTASVWALTDAGERAIARGARLSATDDVLESLRELGEATTAELAEHTGRGLREVGNALRRAGMTSAYRLPPPSRLAVWRAPAETR